MFQPFSARHFLTILVVCVLFSNCAWINSPSPQTAQPQNTGQPAAEQSELPFNTKEPESYQAEIVTSFLLAEESEQKIFVARDGAKRRIEYSFAEIGSVVWIETGAAYILLLPERKIHAEMTVGEATAVAPLEGESLTDFLTTELLSGKIDARFENLGAEKISGITAGKYRAVFPDNENTQSFIWVDEASGMVLRTEMISTSPEGETTKVVTEINNFKLSAESALFEIPSGSRKVLLNEIRDIFSRERGEEE